MTNVPVSELFFIRFGTANPFWKFNADSKAVQLYESEGKVIASSVLDSDKFELIKKFEAEVSSIQCDVGIYEESVTVFLIGMRLTDSTWGGVVSEFADFKFSPGSLMQLPEAPPKNVVHLFRTRAV